MSQSDAGSRGEGTAQAAGSVRCYGCGRRAPGDADGCPRCNATFRTLCSCGRNSRFDAAACSGCGARLSPRRYPLLKRVVRRAVLALVVLGCASAVAATLRRAPAWGRRERAQKLYAEGDLTGARRELAALLEDAPDDAVSWYLLAKFDQELGFEEDVYLLSLRRSFALDPRLHAARLALIHAALANHRPEEALHLAEEGVRDPLAPPEMQALLGLARLSVPGDARVDPVEALETALRAGRQSPELVLTLGAAYVRRYGVLPREIRPSRYAVAVQAAERVLDEARFDAPTRDRLASSIARVYLAQGRAAQALTEVTGALERLGADAPPARRADLLLVAAAAAFERGDSVDGLAHAEAALAAFPQAATRVCDVLVRATGPAVPESVLRRAAKSADPEGAIRAALATFLLASGDASGALAETETLLRDHADSDAYRALQVEVLIALGRFDDADALNERLAVARPDDALPLIRRAQLAVARASELVERERVLRESIATIAALDASGSSAPDRAGALARMRLAAGDAPEAIHEELSAVLESAPDRVDLWILAGEALSRSSAPGATARSVDAFERAFALRPYGSGIAVRLAEALLAAGDPAAAVRACTRHLATAAARRTESQDVLHLRGRAQRRLQEWVLAAADYAALEGSDGASTDRTIERVDTEYRAGLAEQARATAARAREALGDDARTALDVLVALHEGESPSAASARDPGGLVAAELHLATGELDAAVARARARIAASANDVRAHEILVFALLDRDPVGKEHIEEARRVVASLPAATPAAARELLRGRLLLAEGRAEDATEPLRLAALAAPRAWAARYYHGDALFRSGDRDRCFAELRSAVTAPSAPPTVARAVASRLQTAARETTDAAARQRWLAEAVQIAPSFVPAVDDLCAVLSSRGDHLEAAQCAERAVTDRALSRDEVTRLRCRAAASRLVLGQVDAAKAHLDAVPEGGRDQALAGVRAHLRLASGDAGAAEREFRAALEAEPGDAALLAGLVDSVLRGTNPDSVQAVLAEIRGRLDADPAAALGIADLLLLRGRNEAGYEEARRWTGPNVPPAVACRAAVILARLGRTGEAVAASAAAAGRASGAALPEARLAHGMLLARYGGDPDGALAIAREVAAAPDVPRMVRREAAALEAEGLLGRREFAGAAAAARAALPPEGEPSAGPGARIEARARFVLGYVEHAAGRVAAAIEETQRAVALDPLHHLALNNLASMLAAGESGAQSALPLARRMTGLAPGDPNGWDTRATCARRAGAAEEAGRCWRRALELYAAGKRPSELPRAQTGFRYAEFLRETGRTEEARQVARDVVSWVPGTELAKRALDFTDAP